MKQSRMISAVGAVCIILLAVLSSCGEDKSTTPNDTRVLTPAGDTLYTYVNSPGLGEIAVRVELPESARYPEGAPVVVHASTFFAGAREFHRVFDTMQIGAIAVSYVRPGITDVHTGKRSGGTCDYGGPNHLAALRDVIRFASGEVPDVDGAYLDELIAITPIFDNVGMYASSHSGIVATNVLAYHGSEIPRLKYFVGRENPTRDEMYALELGHFDEHRNQIFNPHYHAEDYTRTTIHVDYSKIGWVYDGLHPTGRPDFLDDHGQPAHLTHPTICPTPFNTRFYSRGLTQALLDNGALTLDNWPDDLATPRMTQDVWPFRTTVHNYPKIALEIPDLKVMLTFAEMDHVQAAPDKPHIRQAYDGLRKTAGLEWVRLNPDRVYAEAMDPVYASAVSDNPANTEPADWMDAEAWGFGGVTSQAKYDIPVAAVAEMADRVRADDWSDDLDNVLFDFGD